MKFAVFFVLLSTLLASVQGDTHEGTGTPIKRLAKTIVVPNRFIIEVDDLSALHVRRGFDHPLDAVYHELEARAIKVDVAKEFRMDGIFNGAALIVKNSQDVAVIQKMPGIKAIRPVKIFQRPTLPKRIIPSGPSDPNIPPDGLSTHILGGVDKVHAEGNTGTGVKIGIIDTGVDYNHPALGSNGFGPGKKIVTGYDFAGSALNLEDPQPQPNPDPMDCDGHGTHVAGIIAAVPGNEYNISGVAYGATLAAYKVFDCAGHTTDDILVESLLQGVKDGMDILTLSLGDNNGWSASSSAVVADRISNSGKIITVAAGNDGASGSWYASSPATAEHVISVGSVDNTVIPLQNATVHGVDYPGITYYSGIPLKINGSLPIYATSKSITVVDDACAPLPDSTPDLSTHLVIIRRGTCAFTAKLANAAAKGAKTAFIYDNGAGFAPIETGGFKNAAIIQATDGEFLVQQFAAGANITISFPQSGASFGAPDSHGGLMSDFSSYGPSFNFRFKPAFSAPGGNVMSTFPVANGSFAVLSGTSMATPYVAGSAALLLAAKGKSEAVMKGARTLFETTSKMLPVTRDDAGVFNTVSKAGAGLLDVYSAIHATTLVSPGELVLNDTANFKGRQIIDVRNAGDSPKQYTLKHVPAQTALTMKDKSIHPSLGPVPLISAAASVSINPTTFTVQPGDSQKVTVSITPPADVDSSRFPVYSGFVEVTSGSETYHVTYLGLAASLKDHQILDNTTEVLKTQPPALLDADGNKQVKPQDYTFNGTDYPTLMYRLVMGTPALRADLVDPSFDLKPTFERRQLVVPGITFPHKTTGSQSSFDNVNVIGRLFSRDYATRNNENLGTDSGEITAYYAMDISKPQFANGTAIPNGQYRILIRALKITGDAKDNDYESWLSPIIGIRAS